MDNEEDPFDLLGKDEPDQSPASNTQQEETNVDLLDDLLNMGTDSVPPPIKQSKQETIQADDSGGLLDLDLNDSTGN